MSHSITATLPAPAAGATKRRDGARRVLNCLHICLLSALVFAPDCAITATPDAKSPGSTPIVLRDFKLVGDLSSNNASFTLTAIAKVENAKGGSVHLLSGPVALSELGPHPNWRVRAEPNRYVAEFDRRGEFPISIRFNAAVRQSDGWNKVDFHVAPSALQPIVLEGLGADTQFQFAGAARPERSGNDFVSFLPSDGAVYLSWKEARAEVEGKLFYAAEMLSQITVSPGRMRQVALLNFKVMQGELNRVTLLLRSAEWAATGQVTLPPPAIWPSTPAAMTAASIDLDATLSAVGRYRYGDERKALHALQVGQVVIAPGLTDAETTAFVTIANAEPAAVRAVGGPRTVLGSARVAHIAVVEVSLRASDEEGLLGMDLLTAPLDDIAGELEGAAERWATATGEGTDEMAAAAQRLETATRDIAIERVSAALMRLDEDTRMKVLAYSLKADSLGMRMDGMLDVIAHMKPATLARLLKLVATQANTDPNRIAAVLPVPAENVKRLKSLLRFVELYDARNRLARRLSGGMQRRLHLALRRSWPFSIVFKNGWRNSQITSTRSMMSSRLRELVTSVPRDGWVGNP